MPTRAGASDKAGNRYEYLWTVDHLLRILTDEVISLTLEPLQQGESDGIEFIATMQNRTNEYWSIKRQTTASGWTLSALTSPNSTGRSILGDLFKHVGPDDRNRAVFASTLGAGDFAELRELADDPALFDQRLNQSLNLREKFKRHLLPLAGGDVATALKLLERTRNHTIDEPLFRKSLYETLRRTLYKDSGDPLDPAEVYGLLADHVSQQVHRRIDRAYLVGFLGTHNLKVRNWATETTVQQRVRDLCDEYVKPIEQEWLNSNYVSIPVDEAILDEARQPRGSKILVIAGAGSGKSSTLANVVRKLQQASVPVLPIRFDQVDEGIMSTGELGRRLSLPESPALVLAGIASGGRAALVVDQLDAVSIASGRRVDLWNVFDGLQRELSQFSNLTLIVGCRQFDLDHDPRMRAMKANQAGFTLVHLKPLTAEIVESILNSAGIAPSTLEPPLRELLTLPLHLSMFLSLSSSGREGVLNQDDLFDRFWTDAQQRVNHRAGRNVQWIGIFDRLSVWLSNHQRLSAPENVLEEFEADAAVLASERILIRSNRQYRFFHELFFDYVFARRFFSAGRNVVDFLLSDEQHLFRRAQVRQILMYIRQQDRLFYLQELHATLLHPEVRFHIKQLIFQVLRSLPDPTLDEWKILQDFGVSYPDLQLHLRGVTYGQVAWFDVQRSAGYFDRIFSDQGTEQEQLDAISLLNARDILRARPQEVRVILFAHRQPGEHWDNVIVQLCRSGEFHHDRQLFGAFLDLMRRGKIGGTDGSSPNVSELRYLLHAAVEERPPLAAEAIAVWLEMMHRVWTERTAIATPADGSIVHLDRFYSFIDRSGLDTGWISNVAVDFRSFVQYLFPVVVLIIRASSQKDPNYLASDDTWTIRGYGDHHLQLHSELLEGLANSLERLANANPEELDRVLGPYAQEDSDPIAYLWLRAKSANAARYAEEVAAYLGQDARRLKIGYRFWSGNGNAQDLTSIQAVRICSPLCSEHAFRTLEQTILKMKDSLGMRWRGARQVRLLEALQASRRSQVANRLYVELDRKFPHREREAPQPEDESFGWVGPPIPQEAQGKMSDDQWIGAFRKYQDKQFKSPLSMAGGEHELAQALEMRAKEDPIRFCRLARSMSSDLAPTYFEAILRGVTARGQDDAVEPESLDATCDLVHRIHDLPNHPAGRWICWLVQSWKNIDWPEDIIDIVCWYAEHDRDPHDERKRVFISGEEHGFGAFEEGMNTTRGAAAQAIATILFKNPDRLDALSTTIRSLASDRMLSVRACTVTVLIAALNAKPEEAIAWFKTSLSLGKDILNTYHVERFVYFAYRNSSLETQPILDAMFLSSHEKVQVAAARLACLLSLIDQTAQYSAGRAKVGSPAQREAAARVYADNIAHERFGEIGRRHVKQFFHDEEPSVRLRAAGAFRKLSGLTTLQQQDLIEAFLSSGPDPLAIQILLDALDESPVALPDLVLKVAQLCASEVDPSDSTQRAHRVSMELPKIVVRLLVQSRNHKVRAACLDLIDDMGKRFFLGISDELQRAVR